MYYIGPLLYDIVNVSSQFISQGFQMKRNGYNSMWAASWENLFMTHANNKVADQPAHSLPREYNTSSFYIQNFKPLPSFCGCADWFESYLVANPEDRFPCDEAQFDVYWSPSDLTA